MVRRTTIEIDEDLLKRAREALGQKTTRATVEEALRRAARASENDQANRVRRQRRYLKRLAERIDVAALRSGEMWR